MKTPFLKTVADDLLAKTQGGLEKVCVVLPNKRARLFMNNYLLDKAEHPIWSPKYVDINELFASGSNLVVADPIELVYRLYKSFCDVYKGRYGKDYGESFDEFYFFGEILLKDFDDVDTSCVDAQKLFQHVSDLEALDDDFSHLDDEQRRLIENFFGLTSGKSKTELQNRYFEIWDILYDVYKTFRDSLRENGLAYPGMVARDVVEGLSDDKVALLYPDEKYAFVGFNVLKNCEQKLFAALKSKSLFYWDCDTYFLGDKAQEAGRFLRENLKQFPNVLKETDDLKDLTNVTIVEAPNELLQTAYISEWLKGSGIKSFDNADSAIVFGKEKLLVPALRSLPAKIETERREVAVDQVNVTMGFPLSQTPIYSFVQHLFTLVSGYDAKKESVRMEHLLPWLDHAYTSFLFEDKDTLRKDVVDTHFFLFSLKELESKAVESGELGAKAVSLLAKMARCESTADFAAALRDMLKLLCKGVAQLSPLYSEALYQIYYAINRLCSLLTDLENGESVLGKQIFIRFLQRLMNAKSIPYHGEPEKGLQLMGMLETRNMDFKNLLVLSVNEGVLPKAPNTTSSFIPNFLRRAFGMNHSDHQDSLYAYHFYHLLQRADKVTLVYVKGKEDGGKTEVSRFVLQLLAEHPKAENFEQLKLQPGFDLLESKIDQVDKTPAVVESLKQRSYSPSALNNYINCPMSFYFEKVLGLKDNDDELEEMDNALLGNIFHGAMENIYKCFRGEPAMGTPVTIEAATINAMLDKRNASILDAEICKAFSKQYFNNSNVQFADFNGEQKVYFTAVKNFVISQLKFDLKMAPFESISLETKYYADFKLDDGTVVKVGGTVDRLDRKDGVYLLKDYKTSAHNQEPKLLDEYLKVAMANRPYHAAQLFVYADVLTELMTEKGSDKVLEVGAIKPMLLYVRTFNKTTEASAADIQVKNSEDPKVLDTINDFSTIRDEFDGYLRNLLKEILNPEIPFEAKNESGSCNYCKFTSICGKAKLTNY